MSSGYPIHIQRCNAEGRKPCEGVSIMTDTRGKSLCWQHASSNDKRLYREREAKAETDGASEILAEFADYVRAINAISPFPWTISTRTACVFDRNGKPVLRIRSGECSPLPDFATADSRALTIRTLNRLWNESLTE